MLGLVLLVGGTSAAWAQEPPPPPPPPSDPTMPVQADAELQPPYPAAPPDEAPQQPYPAAAPPPDAGPYAPPGAAPAQPAPTVDQGVLDDANATTNFFMPTALTPPAGSFGFHDYELFIIGASYSPTDQLLLSGSTLVPLFADQPFIGLFSAKYQVVRTGAIRAALHASTFLATADDDAFSAATVGGVVTACLNVECSSHLSGYAAAGFAHDSSSAAPFVFAGGAVLRLTDRVKFLVEADSALVAGEINEVANGFLFWYGLRFTSANISGDIGFVKPVSTDEDFTREVFPIGFPVVSFTFRS